MLPTDNVRSQVVVGEVQLVYLKVEHCPLETESYGSAIESADDACGLSEDTKNVPAFAASSVVAV